MRHTPEQLETWRREGCALMANFFSPEEVAAVRADFELLFADQARNAEPLVKQRPAFNQAQFKTFEAIPFECSPALNLIGVHPALIAFAREALGTDRVHLYQCQVWAKFTGAADYAQPFHCDYQNHTLTAPAEDDHLNAVTFMCYFSDVTEAHGPMHYVPRSESARVAPPEATLAHDPYAKLHQALLPLARSSAASAGSVFPYGIDIYHRGTNMTAPNGHRYAVTACFKRADNDAIGYHAWPFHHTKPWRRIFEHATPDQLSCFGVPLPGDAFWTPATIARSQARYPGWNMSAYREAL